MGQHAEGIVAESTVFPMVERIEHDPEFSRFSRDEKVQKLPASRSSSELSAHQMVPAGVFRAFALELMGAGSSVNPLPYVPDSLHGVAP